MLLPLLKFSSVIEYRGSASEFWGKKLFKNETRKEKIKVQLLKVHLPGEETTIPLPNKLSVCVSHKGCGRDGKEEEEEEYRGK